MRDLSPSELEVYERAAESVRVFQRVEAQEIPKEAFSKGCFDCTHDVGNMSGGSDYTTASITVLDENYLNNGVDNFLTFVLRWRDRFWTENSKHWLGGMYRTAVAGEPLNYPRMARDYGGFYLTDSNPFLYVRSYAFNNNKIRHINSRINLEDFYDISADDEIVVTFSPNTEGIYVHPDFCMARHDLVPIEKIRAFSKEMGVVKRLMGSGPNGVNLKPIRSNKTKTSTKKKAKLTWAEANAMEGADLNDFFVSALYTSEQGNS